MQRQRFIAVAFAAMVFAAAPAAAQDTAPSPLPEAEAPPPGGEDSLAKGWICWGGAQRCSCAG